jgi:hypothetical protein
MSDTDSNEGNPMQALRVFSADDSGVVQMLLSGRIPDGQAAPQQRGNVTRHDDADADADDDDDDAEGGESDEEHHSDSNSYLSENECSCEHTALKASVDELRDMVRRQQQTIEHQQEQLKSYKHCNERLLSDQHEYQQQMLAVNRQFEFLTQRVEALEKNRAKSRMDAPSRAQEVLQSPVQMITMRTSSQAPGFSPVTKPSNPARLSQSKTILEEKYIEDKLMIATEQTKTKFPDFELSGLNLVAAKKYLSECYPIQDQLTSQDQIDSRLREQWACWKSANPDAEDVECPFQDPDTVRKLQEYPEPPKITFGTGKDEAAGSDEALKCESCKESGILMECTGCNKGIHFYCVDWKRPPKGGGHPYYCNLNKCKASFFIKCLGWKPKSISEETIQCGICTDQVSVTSRCNLVNAIGEPTCAHHDKYCTLCIHKYVKAQKQATESFGCPLCKAECHALLMEGSDEPEAIETLTSWNENDTEQGLIDTYPIASSSIAIHRGRVRKTQEELHEESQVRQATINSELLELAVQVHQATSHDVDVVVGRYHDIMGIEVPDDDDDDHDQSDTYSNIMRKLDDVYKKAYGRSSTRDGKRRVEALATSELPMAKASNTTNPLPKRAKKDADAGSCSSSSFSHNVTSPPTASISEDAAEPQKPQEVSPGETTGSVDVSDLYLDPLTSLDDDWMAPPTFLNA